MHTILHSQILNFLPHTPQLPIYYKETEVQAKAEKVGEQNGTGAHFK